MPDIASLHTISETDLLVVVDMQNDFMPGGPLAVPNGDLAIPIVNRLAHRFKHLRIDSGLASSQSRVLCLQPCWSSGT